MKFNVLKFCKIFAENGMTLRELEKASGIDCANLSRYKNGRCKPNLRNIAKIAKGLSVEIEELVDC